MGCGERASWENGIASVPLGAGAAYPWGSMEIPSESESSVPLPEIPKIRLQRFLASCGLGSRRACEEYILEGRVTVDGVAVTELGTTVNPSTQKILLDGEKLRMERKKYYLFNKPTGVLCTNSDPKRRPRVIDYFPDAGPRLFTVGRLDEDSEGLLLVTNDGDLAQRMAHPRYRIYRTYSVQVAGFPTREIFEQMKKGVYFPEGRFKVLDVQTVRRQGQSMWLEVILSEGHNREIRRLFARMGHKVMRLERIAFGPLTLGKLKLGEFRELRHEELERLHAVLAKAEAQATPRKAPGKKRPARPASGARPIRDRREGGRASRDDGLIEEIESAYEADFDVPTSRHPALPDPPPRAYGEPEPPPTRQRSPRGENARPFGRSRPPREGERPAGRPPRGEGAAAGDRPFGRRRPPAGEGERPAGRPLRSRGPGDRPRTDRPRTGRPEGEGFRTERPAGDRPRFERAPGKRPPRERPETEGVQGERPRRDRRTGEQAAKGAEGAVRKPRRDQNKTSGGGGGKRFSAGPADRRFSNRPSSGEAKRRPARKKKPRRGEGRK